VSGLSLRKSARKIRRLERRWSRASDRLPFPRRLSDRLAARIRRLCERVGDVANATVWRWLGTDPEEAMFWGVGKPSATKLARHDAEVWQGALPIGGGR
jgi:hypothetical protein